MFKTILTYEIQYWLRKPISYFFLSFYFLLSLVIAADTGGALNLGMSDIGKGYANSPMEIFSNMNGVKIFLLFTIPAFLGEAVYRDFQGGVHQLLYSYPLGKKGYLLGKLCSSFLMMALMVLMTVLGMMIGYRLPGINEALVLPFNFLSYAIPYFLYALPNLLIYGVLVFAVVLFTRKRIAGFIAIIVLMLLENMISGSVTNLEQGHLGEILDPTGHSAIKYYTQYWTPLERSVSLVPIKALFLYNRLFWIGLSALIFGITYRRFSFHQLGVEFGRIKNREHVLLDNKFQSFVKFNFPKIDFDFSVKQNLSNLWAMSNMDVKYIIRSLPFVAISLFFLGAIIYGGIRGEANFGTQNYPTTASILNNFKGSSEFILILTLLYSGLLVHRDRISKMDNLLDITATPNWLFPFAKVLTLAKMQVLLLLGLLLSGVIIQLSHGYYHFEIGHYLFELFILQLPVLIIWAMVSVFFQSLIGNIYLAFFFLIICTNGINMSQMIGIEQDVFRPVQGPDFSYSDMEGYGSSLAPYFVYRFYWLLSAIVLLITTVLIWKRGIVFNLVERMQIAKRRLTKEYLMALAVFSICFLSLGSFIWYDTNITHNNLNTAFDYDNWSALTEKKYKRYEELAQPKIIDVDIKMDIYPEENRFHANGKYIAMNKSEVSIDTILINHPFKEESSYLLKRKHRVLQVDTISKIDIILLEKSLLPGEQFELEIRTWNVSNNLFRNYSKAVSNGTVVTEAAFPGFGYRNAEITEKGKRAKFGLPAIEKKEVVHPGDSLAVKRTFDGKDADFIHFAATVSTSSDQRAIAPGHLEKEWTEDGRNYFQYKLDHKIKRNYGFYSARYEVKREHWNGIDFEVYHHPGHDYAVDNLLNGMKKSIQYCTKNFGPYQHKSASVVEFPLTVGSHATVYGSIVPFSEERFLQNTNGEGIDVAFYTAAHEIAHQWWGHQLVPANVPGGKMLSESMAEFVATEVLAEEYGIAGKRKFLAYQRDAYFKLRGRQSKAEQPLMLSDGQHYINYMKGDIIFTTLQEYLGRDSLQLALKRLLDSSKEAYAATSVHMVEELKKVSPDSLLYLIEDGIENVTFYENEIEKARGNKRGDDLYEVTIDLLISKYRTDEHWNKSYSDNQVDSLHYKTSEKAYSSLPLADYLELAIYDEKNNLLYLKKHKFQTINTTLVIPLKEKPWRVEIDPNRLMMEQEIGDNGRQVVF